MQTEKPSYCTDQVLSLLDALAAAGLLELDPEKTAPAWVLGAFSFTPSQASACIKYWKEGRK